MLVTDIDETYDKIMFNVYLVIRQFNINILK